MPLIKNKALIERNTFRIYGCSLAEALALNAGQPLRLSGSAARRYTYQRQAAFARGIDWEITFPEWVRVWAESGRWSQRGVGRGAYCMARNGDAGPYRVGNVSIETCVKNSRDGLFKRFGTPKLLAHINLALVVCCMGSILLFLPLAEMASDGNTTWHQLRHPN
jgi:hypothetical protein